MLRYVHYMQSYIHKCYCVDISFAECTCFPNTGHIMHTARWANINICLDMYNTCSHIIWSDIICIDISFAECTCSQYRLHNAHSQMGWYNICPDMYNTRSHIIRSDIICVDISLQHVPVPNTGHIMHTARWADIIWSRCTYTQSYNHKWYNMCPV